MMLVIEERTEARILPLFGTSGNFSLMTTPSEGCPPMILEDPEAVAAQKIFRFRDLGG